MNLFKKPSLLRNLLLSFLLFGVAIGVVFPFFAEFFVDWKPGMYGWFFAACVLAGAAIGGINYLLVKLVLLGKLKRIAEVANAISRKDVTHSCVMESHDVIGEIIGSFNVMAATLRNMIGQINNEASSLHKSSSVLQEVTSVARDGAMQQQSQVEQVVTAMNEMAATAQEVARHAADTAQATQEADQHGNTAKVVVVEAMGAVDMLAAMVQSAAEVIGKLEQESENIGNVLEVINGIAEQTNLLALNAAIEAARAGDQGRGFAVVADEVRTLATRTQQSTEEISGMIERLQAGSREAVSAMEKGQQQALHGVDLTEQAAEALAVIAGAITSIKDMSIQIASAAEEQNAVVEEVNRNAVAINEVVNESTRNLDNINRSSGEVAQLASELHEMIADFKTA